MNTFFTVWFLASGAWVANVHEGWQAYDRKTEAACQASIQSAKASDPADAKLLYSCEKDATPKQKIAL